MLGTHADDGDDDDDDDFDDDDDDDGDDVVLYSAVTPCYCSMLSTSRGNLSVDISWQSLCRHIVAISL